MAKEVIATDKAPAAIGPYVQATKLGDLVFTSGQIPLDPATGVVEHRSRPGHDEAAQTAAATVRRFAQAQGIGL